MYEDLIRRYLDSFAHSKFDETEAYYELLPATGSIMLSAPHSARCYRNDSIHAGEVNTGIIAMVLHDIANCPVIATRKFSMTDPNYDMHSPYKEEIAAYANMHDIRLFIDIHGCSRDYEAAIEFGTVDVNNRSLLGNSYILNILKDSFSEYLLNTPNNVILTNRKFCAKPNYTLTHWVSQQLDIPSIQIEINRLYREPDMLPYTINALYNAIVHLGEIL